MVGRDVRPRRQGQHGEGLAETRHASPDAGDAEPGLAAPGEQPLVLAFLPGVLGVGELVEAVGDDQAASRREIAALRAEVVDGPAVLPRPAPAPLHQLAGAALALD